MKPSRIHGGLLSALLVLAASVLSPALALAQVPATAELYGVHETIVQHDLIWANPFRDVVLNASYRAPSGRIVNFFGFYDGNGAGGMVGNVWRIRFMPDEVGAWTVSWAYSDGTGSGSGGFTTFDTGIPGPPRLDPGNPKLLVDARGNPIHWRGYGIKHVPSYLEPPLQLWKATAFANNIIDGYLVPRGYNAAYVTVPTGWPAGTCNPLGTAEELERCPLWGNYTYYALNAGHFFDVIIQRLHQRRVWAVGWITFGIQTTVLPLWENHQPLMRYFVARYGAYYNYFMWSPMWEMQELSGYEYGVDVMMNYLVSIDPWRRLQGVHDRAHASWQEWQSIQPRQQPSRTIFDGNNRTTGVDASLGAYNKVIIGAEDLWEYCSGDFGKPRNATEVRRGLIGELFANVLPIYDELIELNPPCGGVGNGAGGVYVRGALDWWYATVRYRDPAFTMLNHLTWGGNQICSGIPGREYVLYRQDGGLLTLDLRDVPPTTVFSVTAIDAVTGAQVFIGNINGGAPVSGYSPFPGDTLVYVRAL